MQRPYELPHDMHKHNAQGFKAKDLTMGVDLERRVMIPCPVIRAILQHLTSRGFRGPGSGQVSQETKNMLDHWIKDKRPCLLAFLKLDRVPQDHVKTPPDHATFTKYLRGWQGSCNRGASDRSAHPLEHPASMEEDCDGTDTSSGCTYCLSGDANQLLINVVVTLCVSCPRTVVSASSASRNSGKHCITCNCDSAREQYNCQPLSWYAQIAHCCEE